MKRNVPLTRKKGLGNGTSKKSTKASSKPKTKAKSDGRIAPTTKQVDILWSLVVRERAIYECEMHGCGGRQCGGGAQAHHIFGRYMAVRWDLDNGICLCGSHHLHYVHSGNTQARAQEDIRELIGEDRYQKVLLDSHKTGKNSAGYRREKYAFLSAELARLKERNDPFYSEGAA